MDFGIFDANRKQYGECASWAVWDQGSCEHLRFEPAPDEAPGFFLNRAVESLNAISSQAGLEKRWTHLDPNVVLVALNFADRDEATQAATEGLAFHAFHEETGSTSDKRLRDACFGTRLWGGYITDFAKIVDGRIQPIRESNSSEIRKRLNNDPDFCAEQVDGLIEELKLLEANSPTIVALGNDVHDILTKPEISRRLTSELGPETRILKIKHYSRAAGIRHSDYVSQVHAQLRDQSFM